MPTTRPRHMITESDEIANALDEAAIAWPEIRGNRSELMRRLILAGQQSVHVEGGAYERVRRAAGAATGAFPRNARAELLEEWPE